jgi:hypothetical protein
MSDWIDNLKQSEETKERAQRQREEWALRCDHLISAKARDLWQGLVGTLEADVSKLCETFRNQDSKQVAIQDKGENHLTVRNATGRRNFTLSLTPDAHPTIRLEFRSREEILGRLQAYKEQISFSVVGGNDVVMKYGSGATAEEISERLLKKLLDDLG